MVQLTEPGIGDIDPDDAAALDQLESVLDAVTAGGDGHLSLALAGGRADPGAATSDCSRRPFASYLFDLIRSPGRLEPVRPGAGDERPHRGLSGIPGRPTRTREAVSVWGARYAASLGGRGAARVGLAMSAGLELLPRDAARAKLAALAEAGRKAELSNEELAKVIDPRAVDARSAALGRYEPPRSLHGILTRLPARAPPARTPRTGSPGETVQPTSVQSPRVRRPASPPSGTTIWGRSPAARSMPSR